LTNTIQCAKGPEYNSIPGSS